ncbi:MAG: type IV toxin-antitoxin system AbiEi family antitoxin domain-containing protein [Solirubrobacteraceae bacterium]
MGRLDAPLAEAAARQHGVVALAQIVELGLTASAVHKRAAEGRLHRVHRGVYSLAPPKLLSWRGRYMAAVLAAGPGAVVSHGEAAALHGLCATSGRFGVAVTVPGCTARRRRGIEIHRSMTLTAADVTTVDGIPCTTVARTLLHLAAVVAQRQLERALDQAEVMRALDLRALDNQLARNPRAVGAAPLRAALALHRPDDAPAESELEAAFLDLCRAAGLPVPERQAWLLLDDGEDPIRVDFAWRAQLLVLETDGRRFHQTARSFESDRRRDQRLALAGWQVVRVTWRQLHERPQEVVALVAGLLRAGRAAA